MNSICFQCHHPIEYFTIQQCGHCNYCEDCSFRNRVLKKINKCPICRKESQKIFYLDYKESYEKCLQRKYPFIIEEYGISTDHSFLYHQLLDLLTIQCKLCQSIFQTEKELENHLKTIHKKQFCPLCFKYQHEFLSERQLFDETQLNQHITSKTPEIHPKCEFCRKAFYNRDMLNSHMKKHHKQCPLCCVDQPNGYYKDDVDLFQHAMTNHIVCMHPSCSKTPMIFKNEFELNRHISIYHDKGKITQYQHQDNEILIQNNQNIHTIHQLELMDEMNSKTTSYLTQKKEYKEQYEKEVQEIFGNTNNQWKSSIIQFIKGKMTSECFLDHLEQLIDDETQRNSLLTKYIETQCDCKKKEIIKYTMEKRSNERKAIRKRSCYHLGQWGRFQRSINEIEEMKKKGEDSFWISTSIFMKK